MPTKRQRTLRLNKEIDKINYAEEHGWISGKKADMLAKKTYKKYGFKWDD